VKDKMERFTKGAPIFVKIDEYKDILDVITLIKGKIDEAKSILGEINELKNTEDRELEVWASELEEVERKVNFIDRTLLDPEAY
jgi:hypothetical protein